MPTPFPEVASERIRPEFETAVQMLAHVAANHPERTAIICDEIKIAYADYYACVAGMVANLIEMGVKGERVIILNANSIETSIATYAVWAAGRQVVLLNPLYTENELGPLIEDVAATVILCDKVHEEMLAPLARATGVENFYNFNEKRVEIDQWRGYRELKFPEPAPVGSDVCILAYTGGTTGLPKAAVHRRGRRGSSRRAA